MLRKLSKRAQTTAEYAILIAIVVGAIVAMQVYVRRGLQGRVRDVVDFTGNLVTGNSVMSNFAFNTSQYEPYYITSNATTNQTGNESLGLAAGGATNRTSNQDSTVNRNEIRGWAGF